MKALNRLILIIVIGIGAMLAVGCSGAAPTPVPTAVPTAASTVAPTALPTAAAPATNTLASSGSGSGDGLTAIAALEKFQAASAFRLDAQAQISGILFGGRNALKPGQDPQTGTVFDVKGEYKSPDSHFVVGGFMGSLIGLGLGFDPDSSQVEMTQVTGKKFARGILSGTTEAKWYSLGDDQAASIQIDPKALVEPLLGGKYQASEFSKTGGEDLDNQTCSVYTASQGAFVAVFPTLSGLMLLKQDKLDFATVDNYEYKFWVCDDGYLHQVRYSFSEHDNTQPDQKGTLTYTAHISDYDGAIAVRVPPDAVPLSSNTASTLNTPTVVAEVNTPARPTVAAASGYDGDWAGKSSTDSPIQFSVENNQITSVLINYSFNSGGCSVGGGYGDQPQNAPVTGESFTARVTDSDGVRYTLTGNFTSKTEASGTLQVKGKTFCGDTDLKATWSAQITPVSTGNGSKGEPTAEPTTSATSTETSTQSSPGNSIDVLSAFVRAVNTQNVDAALALVDDNVVYTFGPDHGIDKASLQSFLQAQVKAGTKYSLSNLEETGDIVSFTGQVSGTGSTTYHHCSAILSDGQIVILTLQ